jgi:hypothetical protein
MTDSILNSTQKILGIDAAYTAFDVDIITHINSAFSTLNQLGIGPVDGFMIIDETTTWDLFLEYDPRINSVKSYVYLRVRLLFDPPTTSYLITAMKEQMQELEWRLNVVREGDLYPIPPEEVIPWR